MEVTGLVADVDFESEKYRWMGRFRFDFQVSKLVLLIIALKLHTLVLSILVS